MTQVEFYDAIINSEVISKPMVDIIKEMDILTSMATQAALNNVLLDLRKRIIKGSKITLEETGELFNVDTFDAWVQNTVEEYSAKLYMSSI